MQVWCPSNHSYCQKLGLPRRHCRHGENDSRCHRVLEISRKTPRYRAKITALGTYRRTPLECVLGRLLFAHQAVNPYRVNTACAPMVAYTWTPPVIPWTESRPAHAASSKTSIARGLDGPDTVFVHWDPTVEGWGVTSASRQGSQSPPCGSSGPEYIFFNL